MKALPYTAKFTLPPGLKTLEGQPLPRGRYEYSGGDGDDIEWVHASGTRHRIHRSDVAAWIKDGLVPITLMEQIFPSDRR